MAKRRRKKEIAATRDRYIRVTKVEEALLLYGMAALHLWCDNCEGMHQLDNDSAWSDTDKEEIEYNIENRETNYYVMVEA